VSDEHYRKQKSMNIYKKREYLRDKINELETNNKVKNRGEYIDYNKDYQCIMKLINDENTNIAISRLSQ
jgi:hypothetical protein